MLAARWEVRDELNVPLRAAGAGAVGSASARTLVTAAVAVTHYDDDVDDFNVFWFDVI